MKKTLLRICIIDDDPIFCFAVKRMIETMDLATELSMYKNGQDAFDYLHQNVLIAGNLPDVIFLDINMPVMNGWDFIAAFETIQPVLTKPVTVYMVSSSVSEVDLEKAKKFPSIKKYIYKPITRFDLSELLAVDTTAPVTIAAQSVH